MTAPTTHPSTQSSTQSPTRPSTAQQATRASGTRARLIRRDLVRALVAAFSAWVVVYSLHPLIEENWLPKAYSIIALLLGVGLLVRLVLVLAWPQARSIVRGAATLAAQVMTLLLVAPGLVPVTPNIYAPAQWNPAGFTAFFEPVQLDIATGRIPLAILGNTLALAVVGVGLLAVWIDLVYVSLRAVALALVPVVGVVIATGLFTPLDPNASIFAAATLSCGLLFLFDVATRPPRSPRATRASGSTRRFRPDARALGIGSTLLTGVVAIGIAVTGGALSARTETIGSPAFAFDATQFGQVAGGSMLDNSVNVASQLRDPEEREVFTFATSDPAADTYVRVGVLGLYQNYTWRQVSDDFNAELGSASEGLQAQPKAPYSGNDVTYTFINVAAQNRYLPVPAGMQSARLLEGSGQWGYNTFGEVLKFENESTRGLSYEVTSRAQVSNVNAWSGPPNGPALSSSVPALLRSVSDKVTANAETKLDKALALQNYFRGFRYNINYQSPTDTDPITGFLQSGEGYCEQFSSVMALMAEYEGIESRVVVGYLGRPDATGNVVVTNHNAHAWPELNMGTTENPEWVRFEPTPAGPTGSYSSPSWQDALDAPAAEPTASDTPSASATPTPSASSAAPAPTPTPTAAAPSASATPTAGTAAAGGAGVAEPTAIESLSTWFAGLALAWKLAAAALGLAALAFLGLHVPFWWTRVRRALQRRRHLAALGDAATSPLPSRPALEAAYAELAAVASDRGFGWPPGTAPSDSLDAAERSLNGKETQISDELRTEWGALVEGLNERRYRDPSAAQSGAEATAGVVTAVKAAALVDITKRLERETHALRPRAHVARTLWATLRARPQRR